MFLAPPPAGRDIFKGRRESASIFIFDRFFRKLSPADQQLYRGKADTENLRQHCVAPPPLLAALQDMMNEALRNEKQGVAEHVDHDPFHFDYVDSDEANALSFCDEGYSFIGVTIPLVNLLWRVCVRLTGPEALAARTAIAVPDASIESLAVVLFRIQLNFIASHEYTHVVHGHVIANSSFEHPPTVARMHLIMQSVLTWCAQNRPALEAWITPRRFISLIRSVAVATLPSGAGDAVDAQVAFLSSPPGLRYMEALEANLKLHVESHGSHRKAGSPR